MNQQVVNQSRQFHKWLNVVELFESGEGRRFLGRGQRNHQPYHIHIYRGAEFVGRFDIENQIAMDGDQVLRYLEELGYKKSSKG